MKKGVKILVGSLLAAVLLFGCVWGVLRFGFDIDIFDRGGWAVEKNGQTRYLDYYGHPLTDWQLVDGKWYYFDPQNSGYMVTGWLELDTGRYYLDETGARNTGWVRLEDGVYYISPSNGSVVTGWMEDETGRYYLQEGTGRAATGWLDLDAGRYWFDDDGRMCVGWVELAEGRYFLGPDGIMLTGWLDTSDGVCYLDETTGRAATGWIELETGKHYLGEDGYLCTGWTDTPEGRCYLDDQGRPATGWLDTQEGRYFLDENGAMTVGWLDHEDNRYYFREDGTMVVGKLTLDDVNYFFTSTGAYVVLVNKWNPVPEDYETDLVTYGKWKVDRACYDALSEMLKDLKAVGYYSITSAYRSEATQQSIWDTRYQRYRNAGYSKQGALDKVALEVAVPGTSEHHLGLAVDISAGDVVDAWLAENSWRYGFILRYPNGTTELTGIIYEPWHFRYVGKELARELYDLDICLEEYMNRLTENGRPDQPVTMTGDAAAEPTEDLQSAA